MLPVAISLIDWLREQCSNFEFVPAGVFQTDGKADWPLVAQDVTDLTDQLDAGGFLSPLPSESAALANVIEVALVDFLLGRLANLASDGKPVSSTRGAARGYPDLEVEGDLFGGGFCAVDIKMARIKMLKKGESTKTESRITLYTGNTYFKHPTIAIGGIRRPFADYRQHLDIIGLYEFDEQSKARVKHLELLVHPPWKIASRERSSTTREYIGAVDNLQELRAGTGSFETETEFYAYWRKFPFKVPKLVQKELEKALRAN